MFKVNLEKTKILFKVNLEKSDAKWAIFQPYRGENKLHFDNMMSVLY
jgi:hypothetical protein